MRDPIAQHGSAAIDEMTRLLGDPVLGNFAVVVLRKIGDLGNRPEVVASLRQYSGPYSSDAVRRDVTGEIDRQEQLLQEAATTASRALTAARQDAADRRRTRLALAMTLSPASSDEGVKRALSWLKEKLVGSHIEATPARAASVVTRVRRAEQIRAALGLAPLTPHERALEASDAVTNMLKAEPYRRWCWACGRSLNSILNPRCHVCGWYFCTCGACSRDCPAEGR